ncbi:MAG: sulfite exporter TauE/SafE family protein [Polyangiales bacterium]
MLEFALLLLAGAVAGYANVIAGAGSLVALPVLIFAGLGATEANATNRIAVLVQSLVALAVFRQRGVASWGPAWRLALPASCGAVLGAWLAAQLSDAQTQACIFIAMFAFLLWSVVATLRPRRPSADTHTRPAATAAMQATATASPLATSVISPSTSFLPDRRLLAVFVIVGLYGGLLQAGTGIFVLLALSQLGGLSLVHANAIKMAFNLAVTVVALAIFAWQGLSFDLPKGLLLAVGTAVGGHLGAHATLSRGDSFVRRMLLVVIALSAGKLLWQLLTH